MSKWAGTGVLQALHDEAVVRCKEGGRVTEEQRAQAWERINSHEAARVRAVGQAIGFGRVMQLAEQEWRKSAIERGDPPGGEFVSGVCRVMLDSRGFKSSIEMMEAYDEASRKLRKAKKKLKKLKRGRRG